MDDFVLGFERLCVIPKDASPLLDVDFEPGTLARHVVARPAQANRRVEHILAPASPALAAIFTGVVHDENGYALPAQTQYPCLDWVPALCVVVTDDAGQRRQVVEDQ